MNQANEPTHFADRLLEACGAKGAPVCVGLDPVFERLPDELRQESETALERVAAIERFCAGVLDAVADHVPCVKVQAACFERYRGAGFDAMFRVIAEAKARGLVVILDAKRGDIGSSSAHYAAGLLGGDDGPDALTVSPYMGADALEPFVTVAAREGKGLFALVRTSNPGGDALQGALLKDGRTVAEAVADNVAQLSDHRGASGYSLLGAVVGATKPKDAVALRRAMWHQIFLVPGFGTQGAGAEDVKPCFHDDGTGALITASRSVIYHFDKTSTDWRGGISDAARDLNRQVAAVLKPRS